MPRSTGFRPPARSRRGLTMIELLVVITIIALLASLASFAALQALGTAQEAQVQVEIDQLAAALEQFKTTYGEYPPGMGTKDVDNGATDPIELPTDRRNRLLSFVSRAFSQQSLSGYWSTIAAEQPITLRYQVGLGTLFNPNFAGTPGAGANAPVFIEDGAPNCCDVETLDAAEALVFWLGGLPRRTADANGRIVFELTGFANDPTAPFAPQPNVPAPDASWSSGRSRTKALFPFDNSRLTDLDNDGWPEYSPPGNKTEQAAPYVYFEAQSYNLQPVYPDAEQTTNPNAGTVTAHAALSSIVGVAKPYARRLQTNGSVDRQDWQITWVEPDRFQIIAAGRDNSYGLAIPAGGLSWTFTEEREPRGVLRMYPDDQRFVPNIGSLMPPTGGLPAVFNTHGLTELDNLTSFSPRRLEADLKIVGVE